MTATVEVERDGPISWIVFDNEERRNAMTLSMYAAVPAAVEEATADPEVRVVIVRGAGTVAFGAGSDISEFAERRLGADAAEYNHIEHLATEALAAIAVPVVAMIHGPCMGGGGGIALTADLRYAADDATFAFPPAQLGIGYPVDATERLRSAVGPAVAKELLFTGRVLDATEALRVGLVNSIVAPGELETTVRATAAVLARNAPLTVAAAKLVVDQLGLPEASRDTAAMDAAVQRCYDSADYREGIAAFLEKRRSTFEGR